MRHPALLATFLVLISGCMFVFDGPDGGDDVCLLGEPALAPAPQRNPETLACESFGGGCNPECGPCPAVALAPIPSWGFCGDSCESLSESACASKAGCRIVKDAACAISGTCTNDFIGCFPTDQGTLADVGCFDARDGWTCSQIPDCVAYHRGSGAANGRTPALSRPFAMCGPEGKSPGSCYAAVSCDLATPACPTNTTPGIANGCYTGACIPTDLCGPVPQQ